jgi:hypothetical protein
MEMEVRSTSFGIHVEPDVHSGRRPMASGHTP